MDSNNNIFQLASLFVNQTARPVFLTGKAGTGKTTFLKYIRENCFKKMAVVAPTGVAAINAGGVTMHSFFQLPFGPFIPVSRSGWNGDGGPGDGVTDERSLFKNIRFNAEKRELLQELELLVIDEISMVRADTLDAVDTILRHFRQQPLSPFGGVQILCIGDLFQLPPVVSNEEWGLLKDHYQSPFFFDALAIRQSPPIYLELKKIYRQKDAGFIQILNNIRNNQAGWEDLEQLHLHYRPDFQPAKEDNYITLTSHNAKAAEINQTELDLLAGRSHAFEASVTGEFNDRSFPAERTLHLKEGAQVMFIKNDKGEARRYFNGKIGVIKRIVGEKKGGEKIVVVFPGEPDELIVEKETWKNIRYNYDREKDKIEEEELGSFSQYPLRLAWAITIHKSQGLTFERAIVDAGASFAPGQVYVALSRLTTIEGLILYSRIHPRCISTDPRVIAFTDSAVSEEVLEDQLQHEQQSFISLSLVSAFNWIRVVEELQSLPIDPFPTLPGISSSSTSSFAPLASRLLNTAMRQQETAMKFARQLEQLLEAHATDGYQPLQKRMQAATDYFFKAIDNELIKPLQEQVAELRGRKRLKKHLQTLANLKIVFVRKKQQLEQALQIVSGLTKGMAATELLSGIQVQKKDGASLAGYDTRDASGQKAKKGDSHRISLEYYKEGRSIADIALRRGLAKTTVESHLASFIPTGEIDIKELVPENKITVVAAVIEKSRDGSLGSIKQRLGEEYSFGEIRAVMKWLGTPAPPSGRND